MGHELRSQTGCLRRPCHSVNMQPFDARLQDVHWQTNLSHGSCATSLCALNSVLGKRAINVGVGPTSSARYEVRSTQSLPGACHCSEHPESRPTADSQQALAGDPIIVLGFAQSLPPTPPLRLRPRLVLTSVESVLGMQKFNIRVWLLPTRMACHPARLVLLPPIHSDHWRPLGVLTYIHMYRRFLFSTIFDH